MWLLPPAIEVCEGYVFTHVCLSMGGGGIPACIAGGIPACLAAGLWRAVSHHALQVSRPTPRGKVEGSGQGGLQAHTQGDGVSRPTPRDGVSRPTPRDGVSRPTPRGAALEGTCSMGVCPWGVPAPGGACSSSRGCLLRGGLLLWGVLPGGICVEPPLHDGYCCGQYASYWNVFLYLLAFPVRNPELGSGGTTFWTVFVPPLFPITFTFPHCRSNVTF